VSKRPTTLRGVGNDHVKPVMGVYSWKNFLEKWQNGGDERGIWWGLSRQMQGGAIWPYKCIIRKVSSAGKATGMRRGPRSEKNRCDGGENGGSLECPHSQAPTNSIK